MSTSMATQNPEALERMRRNDPLPGVGDVVLYFPRPSETRAGMRSVPAMVLKRDEENELLNLMVIYGQDDFHFLDNIQIHRGDDRGWEPRPSSGVSKERFEAFMAEMAQVLFGEEPKPETGSMLSGMRHLFSEMDTLKDRLAKLEAPRKK